MLRLFAVGDESIVRVGFEDPEFVPNRSAERGDGQLCPRRGMRRQEVRDIQIGQDVAVHHDERLLGQIGEPTKRPYRPQRRVLAEIIERDTPVLPLSAECLDQMTQVADANRGPAATRPSELGQDDIQDRSLADG